MDKLEKILEYFYQDDDMYYIKNGYICLFEGFDSSLVLYFYERDGEFYFSDTDGDYKYPPKSGYEVNVYEVKKVT